MLRADRLRLTKLAEQGHVEAMKDLQTFYRIDNQAEESRRWLRAAAESGDAEMRSGVVEVALSTGLPDWLDNAERLMKADAEGGFAVPAERLGEIRRTRGDEIGAQDWVNLASLLRDVRTTFDSGLDAYSSGDLAAAEKMWRKIANTGFPYIVSNLSLLLDETGRADEGRELRRVIGNKDHKIANMLAIESLQQADYGDAQIWIDVAEALISGR